MDVDSRRAQLIEVGSRLFASRPYDEVWIDHVAAEAGVSRGLLYHYFGSKRGLLVAVVEHETVALFAATEPDPELPAPDRIRAVLDPYLNYVATHPHGYRAIFRGAISADSEIRALVDGNLRRQEQRVLAAFSPDQQPSTELRFAVHGWIAFVVATALEWLDDPQLDAAAIRELCVNALTGILAEVRHLHRA